MRKQQERFHDLSTGNYELDRLKAYLGDYFDWEKRLTEDNGVPNAAGWVRFIIDRGAAATSSETVNVEAMRIVDRSLAELLGLVPELAVAIRWRYININVGALVFRFKRLEGRSVEQLDDLADAGEKALLPIARKRGLIL